MPLSKYTKKEYAKSTRGGKKARLDRLEKRFAGRSGAAAMKAKAQQKQAILADYKKKKK